MKKRILTLFMVTILFSCSTNDTSHITIAENFTENYAKGKISEAKKYATESTGKLIDLAISRKGHNASPNFEFVFLRDSISKNNAWVKFTGINDSIHSEELHLIKVDGQWLVNLNPKQKKVFK